MNTALQMWVSSTANKEKTPRPAEAKPNAPECLSSTGDRHLTYIPTEVSR